MTTVYTRINGKLAVFHAETTNHGAAIGAVRKELGDVALSRQGRWKNGPVLALISK